MQLDTAFQMSASNIRFGWGVTREVGMELEDMGARRVLLVIDPRLLSLIPGAAVRQSLEDAGISYSLFDEVRSEPTDASFLKAIEAAQAEPFDAFVAVGGGSALDTAKAANLYSTYPADFLDYVNVPVGKGVPPPGPLKPLIAIPTTAGTGSETTGVAIFDYTPMRLKTGISHRYLRPTLGILDPENTRTCPPAVAASAGLDVLSHALESYTAIPYDTRPRPARPKLRTAYQGANPISDVWCLQALRMVDRFLERAVADPQDDEARAQMVLAASFAGIGFGNAGVHFPHAMAYPVAGMVRGFVPAGYDTDHAMVPHGTSVILNTPAVVRFTALACPERHLEAAQALGVNIAGIRKDDAGKALADRILDFMHRLDQPTGLAAVGYTSGDIPALIQGTLAQERLVKLSPRAATEDELAGLFEESMKLW